MGNRKGASLWLCKKMRHLHVVPGDARFLMDVNKDGATCAPEAHPCPQAVEGWSAQGLGTQAVT